MPGHLYFICPTDHLEAVINRTFQGDNYFLTSLGNSIAFQTEFIWEISSLIETKKVSRVTFVLSESNKMILDAMDDEEFKGLSGLTDFYQEIKHQKIRSAILWKSQSINVPVLSHYLTLKISELKNCLSDWILDHIQIDAKIFHADTQLFTDVHSELLQIGNISLN